MLFIILPFSPNYLKEKNNLRILSLILFLFALKQTKKSMNFYIIGLHVLYLFNTMGEEAGIKTLVIIHFN